ncbi:MAG: BMP family ABC transporter substrate-binding protein [Actinobacteria bacterium]|nr:BMP family ABC transporter substrate-binding protein [Actinomycetota bacterium]MTA08460.1 BMP family ABC transporter substrate-binding protein [Actinomycetota bacterium]
MHVAELSGGTIVSTITGTALKTLSIAAVSALAFTGCAPATPSVDYKACAVSDEGSWNDKSFNESVYDGLTKAKDELGVEIADAESNSAEDFGPNLQAMVDAACDVTFAVGFNLVAAVNEAAKANPEMHFVTIDGWSEGNANLKPVGYAMEQSSYLAGYAAAAYSTTKVIGTYGGMQIDAVTAFMDGFYYGAKAYEKETGTAVTVLGWDPVAKAGDFMGDFAPNSGVSKTIAATQIEAGADVIFPVGGDQFGAVSEAISESGKPGVMIGVDKNIAVTSPEYADMVLTSVEKRMTAATFDIIKELSGGAEFSGDAYVGTLENDGTGLSDSSLISDELWTKLDELKAGIIDGSIDPKA